jgi:hypothetical protein
MAYRDGHCNRKLRVYGHRITVAITIPSGLGTQYEVYGIWIQYVLYITVKIRLSTAIDTVYSLHAAFHAMSEVFIQCWTPGSCTKV